MRGLEPLAGASIAFVALALVTLIGMEVIRSVVDARRKQATGVGGTQDIAMWGITMAGVFLFAAIVLAVAGVAMRWCAMQ